MHDSSALLICSRLPQAKYTATSLSLTFDTQARTRYFFADNLIVLDDQDLVMIIMMKYMLSIRIFSASPQTENAASAFRVRVGVGSSLVHAGSVQSVPNA